MGNVVRWIAAAAEEIGRQPTGQQTSVSGDSSMTPDETREAVDGLFGVMFAYYGRMLADRYGESIPKVKAVWAAELADLAREEWRAGMAWLKDNAKFPPTLPEFRQAAREGRVAAVKIPGWRDSPELTVRQGKLLALPPRIGESMDAYRARIEARIEAELAR